MKNDFHVAPILECCISAVIITQLSDCDLSANIFLMGFFSNANELFEIEFTANFTLRDDTESFRNSCGYGYDGTPITRALETQASPNYIYVIIPNT